MFPDVDAHEGTLSRRPLKLDGTARMKFTSSFKEGLLELASAVGEGMKPFMLSKQAGSRSDSIFNLSLRNRIQLGHYLFKG